MGRDAQVIAGAAAGVESGRLQHGPDHLARVGQLVVALPADERFAGAGPHQSEHHPQGGGLACAIRAEKAGRLPDRRIEGQILHGLYGAEVFAQPADRHVDRGCHPYVLFVIARCGREAVRPWP